MKRTFIAWMYLFSACITPVFAQGTAFTYQGRLNDGGSPANGAYDFRFRLASDPLANNYIGNAYLTNGISVTGGLFAATPDFGAGILTGSNYWLEVDVRTNGAGLYTALTPLQALTPTPYAVFANSSSNLLGLLPAGQLNGPIPNGNLPASPSFSGTVTANNFTGNGVNVSNVNALTLNGYSAGAFWQLGGNNVSPGQFLGSTNNQPVEIWAGGQRAMRFEPTAGGVPNVIGGANNLVVGGFTGATIGGGAANTNASSELATIAGGANNLVSGSGFSSIGGGAFNAIINPTITDYFNYLGGGQYNLMSNVTWSAIAGGVSNVDATSFSFIGAGANNTLNVFARYSVIGGGQLNMVLSNADHSVIGGGYSNVVETLANDTFIGGGYQNDSDGYQTFIGGGTGNIIQSNTPASAIVGGANNWIQTNAHTSFIGGGQRNVIQGFPYVNFAGFHSAIIGGYSNNINGGAMSFIGGGFQNGIGAANYSVVGGGYQNFITPGNAAIIGGGYQNLIQSNSYEATISGGWTNVIGTNAYQATIAGGAFNSVNGVQAAVGGGEGNQVAGNFATVPGGQNNIAGGQYSFAAGQQAQATNDGSFVWADSQNAVFNSTNNDSFNVRAQGGVRFVTGGAGMTVDGSPVLTTGGGNGIMIRPNSGDAPDVINGSSANFVLGGVVGATVAGGGAVSFFGGGPYSNSATGNFCTVGGGLQNIASGYVATVGGGQLNTASGDHSTVSGGLQNTASGASSTVGGGGDNTASGQSSTVGGGGLNAAIGPYSTVSGGYSNTASGQFSFAAGQFARAFHQGAFVWADSQSGAFTSTTNDEFSIRANNGIRIQSETGIHLGANDRPLIVRDWDVFSTNAPSYKAGIGRWGLFMEPFNLTIGIPDNIAARYFQIAKYSTNGTYTTLVLVDQAGDLYATNNVFAKGVLLTSDRNAKEHFTPLNPQSVLAKVAALPITEWNYKSDDATDKHIGPVAQDFHEAFGLNGNDDKHISAVDGTGVALSAIQGLNQEMEELKSENAELKQRLAALEKLIQERK